MISLNRPRSKSVSRFHPGVPSPVGNPALKLANIENARLDHVTRDLLGETLTANR